VAFPRPKPLTIRRPKTGIQSDWLKTLRRPGDSRLGIWANSGAAILMVATAFGAKLRKSFCWVSVRRRAD